VLKDLKVHPDLKVLKEVLVHKVLKDRPEHRDLKVVPGHRVVQEHKEHKELLALLEKFQTLDHLQQPVQIFLTVIKQLPVHSQSAEVEV
jgi:hypothetical protein